MNKSIIKHTNEHKDTKQDQAYSVLFEAGTWKFLQKNSAALKGSTVSISKKHEKSVCLPFSDWRLHILGLEVESTRVWQTLKWKAS